MSRILNSKGLTKAVAFIWVLTLSGCLSKHHLNQERAINAMITIRNAQETFKSVNGHYGTLDELAASPVVSGPIPSPVQNGYRFTIRATPGSYVAVAVPTNYQESVTMSLYLDQTGIIRGIHKNGGEADVKDPPLNNNEINPGLGK